MTSTEPTKTRRKLEAEHRSLKAEIRRLKKLPPPPSPVLTGIVRGLREKEPPPPNPVFGAAALGWSGKEPPAKPTRFDLREPSPKLAEMKPAIQPPSAKRIAAAYGNLVSRQRIHQAVKKYGYPVVLNPDRMFTARLYSRREGLTGFEFRDGSGAVRNGCWRALMGE